ncbi:PREDICTED: UDP-glucuronosyltransferase-like [Ceratosolen solmsi marchali]|uniref:UDP-glucuronosyltransferase n=1 Tax=Ceratosolen solmsi marchali TaxID=326594 RepID=A0AAJ6YDM5_9HYME|nr:PREDICTED: UDP-glucuronosyltransferase-like [Ceratosolen solmsi marchali]
MFETKELMRIIFGAVLLTCYSQPTNNLKILGIFPLNGKSHFIMFERLAKGLAEKGHQIDVYSHFPLKKSIPNYKDFSLDGSLRIIQNNMTYNDMLQYQSLNVPNMMNAVGTNICELMSHPVFQNLLKNPPRNPPYDIIIVEAFLFNCHFAWGRYLNIPMVGIMSTTILDWYHKSFGNPSMPTFTSGSNILQMTFMQRLSNTIFNTLMSQYIQYHILGQSKYIEKYFGPGYPDTIEIQKDLDLLLVNSHFSLEGIRANTPAIVPVAGLHIKDDDTKLTEKLKKWLDDSKSGCIYFSFGSMVRIETFPNSVLKAIYTTFKNISPVRVLMKIANPDELPPGLPSNVMTQTWFSQEQVLKHKNTKLFITHGGLMGVQESIYFAVPMITIPLFGDQHINAQCNVDHGISILIDHHNITEESFTSGIKEVLHNPIYKKNSDKLAKLFRDRPIKPLDTAIYWIEYISRHGKKAIQSPLVEMQWWKANSLDIYAFIWLVLFFFLYVLQVIVKKIYKLCCPSNQNRASSLIKSKKIQ